MPTPRILSRRPAVGSPVASALLAGVLSVGAIAVAAFLPAPAAAETAVAEVSLLAGPGWEYEVLTVAPAGAWMSVDGEAVNGFVPVTSQGVSGWVEAWAVGPDQAAQEAPAEETWNAEGEYAVEGDYAAEGEYVPEETYAEDGTYAAEGDDAAEGETYAAEGDYAADVTYENDGSYAPEAGGAVVSEEPVYSEDPVYEEPAAAAAPAPDLAPPPDQGTHAGAGSEYSEREILAIIGDAARKYGQNPNAMERVARCESGLNPYAVGAGQYYGLFQFVPSTFDGTPYGDGDIFDPVANANAAAWMWEQGRKGEWVCQ